MRTFHWTAAVFAAALMAFVVIAPPLGADAAPAKNLQVFPKGTDTKVIKESMKKISKSLGVECDYCHDISAMDAEHEMKTKARAMLKVTAAINSQMKAAKFKQEVTCNTCHQGQKKPPEGK